MRTWKHLLRSEVLWRMWIAKVLVEEHRDARGEGIDIIVKMFESSDTILQCARIEHVRGNSDKHGRMQTNRYVAKYNQLFEERLCQTSTCRILQVVHDNKWTKLWVMVEDNLLTVKHWKD